MKNCVIFFDCHGMEIKKYFFMNKNLKKDFNIEFIRLNDYVVKNMAFFDNTKLDNKHIMLIENADILILQVIEKNRGFLYKLGHYKPYDRPSLNLHKFVLLKVLESHCRNPHIRVG